MKLVKGIAALLLILGVVMTASTLPTAGAAEKPKKVLRHIVLYKFKEGVSDKQIQEVVDAFCQLPKKIDTVIGFEHGTNVSKEGKSEGFTHAFLVTFRDEKGRDAYIAHPAHQEYVNIVKDRREKVIVVDYWTEE